LNKLVTGLAVLGAASAMSVSAFAQGAAAPSAAPAAAAPAAAGSPFDGTWKTNPKSITWSGKPTVFDLSGGMFSCDSCAPPYKVKVDGTPQAFAGNPYINALAVTVVDDHTIRAEGMRGGKKVGVQIIKVSADGNTLTIDFKGNTLNPGGAPVTTSRTFTRAAPGGAGAHAISGTWTRTAMAAMSPSAGVSVFKMDGAMLRWSSPSGAAYVAGFDGKPYPMKGDPGVTSVTLHKVSATRIVETDWLKGKKVDITTWSVSPSGKTLTMVDNDPQTGVIETAKATKQ